VRLLTRAVQNLALPLSEKLLPGGRRSCPVCNWRGRHFLHFLSADEIIPHCICPSCGSFDRHRLLVLGVRDELTDRRSGTPKVMLGFSLSRALRFSLEHEGLARCFRSDIDLDGSPFAPDLVADLRRAPIADEAVDWLFCSHVLEHIPELELCVDEIVRMLRPGGLAWLQVPLEPGRAHSRRIPVDPHRAHAHAWQFSPDFGTLVQRDQWTVSEIVADELLDEGQLRHFGIDPRERYWLARKRG
jgi:SAM-dependent methyltransferase